MHLPDHLHIPPQPQPEYSPTLIRFSIILKRILFKCVQPFIVVFRYFKKHTNLTFWIISSMLIGILVGHFAPAFAKEIKPLGDAFVMMIKIVIVPLVFSVLVIGIAGHGDDVKKVGYLAIKTIIVRMPIYTYNMRYDTNMYYCSILNW